MKKIKIKPENRGKFNATKKKNAAKWNKGKKKKK